MDEAAVVDLLRGRVVALTGAGLSAPSGLPTFWGSGGMYEDVSVEDLATPEGFARNPAKVWAWYLQRIRDGARARPNAAHRALVDLEASASNLTIITSNVDTLQEQAGSTQVFRLHGNIFETKCTACLLVSALKIADEDFGLPHCHCGGLLRPNVVWFGEYPDETAIEAARRELPRADIVLEIGHSGTVSYGFSEWACSMSVAVVRINPEPDTSTGILHIAEDADIAVPNLVSALLTSS